MRDAAPSVRIRPGNPDHHLWNNNGTWFVHYTVHRNDFTKARVRASLHTRAVEAARTRRDRLFRSLGAMAMRGVCS